MKRPLIRTLFLMPSLGLIACSGGGGGNSATLTPSPVAVAPVTSTVSDVKTPLPAQSGLIAGTFDTIALWNQPIAGTLTTTSPDAVRITVDPATKTYTVQLALPGLPSQTTFELGKAFPDFGHHVVSTTRYSDGRTEVVERDATDAWAASTDSPRKPQPSIEQSIKLYYDISLSHVSLGRWSFGQVEFLSGGQQVNGDLGEVFFVHGSRTAPAEIPVSGTATYTGRSVTGADRGVEEHYCTYCIDIMVDGDAFSFSADFAAQSVSAAVRVEPITDPDNGSRFWGIAASGSAPFTSDGAFTIGLTGSIADSLPTNPAMKSFPATGTIDAAFFGPQAQQMGGTFQLKATGADDSFHAVGAFTASQ